MRAVRAIVEAVTRNIAYTRRLPPEFASFPIYVSPSAGLKFLYRPMSSPEVAMLLRLADELVKPGMVVWDVGANLGLFSFAASVRATDSGAVYALEPDLWMSRLIQRTCRRLRPRMAPVHPLPLAASKGIGLHTFRISGRSRAASSLDGFGTTQAGSISETVCVLTVTLDWLLDYLPPPNVLKIDVEGAELAVLEGATKVLTTVRPRVVCEIGAPVAHEVADLFRKHGYRLFNAEQVDPRQELVLPSWNTLALPT
jgi:FkbM family methyltransferase